MPAGDPRTEACLRSLGEYRQPPRRRYQDQPVVLAHATPASGTDRAPAAATVANTFLIISSPLVSPCQLMSFTDT